MLTDAISGTPGFVLLNEEFNLVSESPCAPFVTMRTTGHHVHHESPYAQRSSVALRTGHTMLVSTYKCCSHGTIARGPRLTPCVCPQRWCTTPCPQTSARHGSRRIGLRSATRPPATACSGCSTRRPRPVQLKPFRVLACAACSLNATGQSRVTLSPRSERLRAACGPRHEDRGPEMHPKRRLFDLHRPT